MSVQDAASLYIARGWSVVPLVPKDKKCRDTDWIKRNYLPADFTPDANIGLKSINGLVDVDCDCVEAVYMAEAFLPRTRAIYGRESRPRSHWLYQSPDIKAIVAYKDLIENHNIIELRVNHQSMAPPSVHPSGEVVTWEGIAEAVEAMVVDSPLLTRLVQLTASGAMLCRYYNPPGNRHDWGLYLAGFLRKLGITQHEAERLVERAGKWNKDNDVKDRLDALRTTYGMEEDAAIAGGTKLAEAMDKGKDFVLTLQKIWGGIEVGVSKTRLDKMNEKHAVLFDQSGNVSIITEETEDGQHQLRYSDTAAMNVLYPQLVQVGLSAAGKPIMKPLGAAWLTHPKRRFYRGIELAPNGHSNEGYYNLWKGFAVEPKQGNYPLFRQHLELLGEHNEDYVDYIWTWLADTVQHPERPVGIALAFKGAPGTGKSTFAKWFGALFGPHFLHLDSEHRLLGNFNAHLHNTIVILADEAVWAGGKVGLGALKRLITEQTLAIERKGLDIINVKNMLHMIVASNEKWMVPVSFDDRRFAIFNVSEKHKQNDGFFGAVHNELFNQGGLQALLYDLQHFKITRNLRLIPNTKEREEQKKQTMNAKETWWFEILDAGEIWDEGAKTPQGDYIIDMEELYSQYVATLRVSTNRESPGFKSSVARFLHEVLPEPYPILHQVSAGGNRGKRDWFFPPLQNCRAYFEKKFGSSHWKVEREPGVDDVPF